LSFGAKVLLSAGLSLFAAGLFVAIFGVAYTSIAPSYAGSVVTFLGATMSIVAIMEDGKQTKCLLMLKVNAVDSSDGK
jgi:hypothetical protein